MIFIKFLLVTNSFVRLYLNIVIYDITRIVQLWIIMTYLLQWSVELQSDSTLIKNNIFVMNESDVHFYLNQFIRIQFVNLKDLNECIPLNPKVLFWIWNKLKIIQIIVRSFRMIRILRRSSHLTICDTFCDWKFALWPKDKPPVNACSFLSDIRLY